MDMDMGMVRRNEQRGIDSIAAMVAKQAELDSS